ncbi:hypothetical protein FB451DRAFT_1191831 [Mycena latifolia]|nr:hypothetical protein FB451DRAFT_1191831 [Mycena latifolia]
MTYGDIDPPSLESVVKQHAPVWMCFLLSTLVHKALTWNTIFEASIVDVCQMNRPTGFSGNAEEFLRQLARGPDYFTVIFLLRHGVAVEFPVGMWEVQKVELKKRKTDNQE